jgi:hypothetical protein
MSKIASFAAIEADVALSKCRELLKTSRQRLEQFVRDPQKDGADSEALALAFKRIDCALGVM